MTWTTSHENLVMDSDHDSGCLSCWPRRKKVKKVQEKAAKYFVCVHFFVE